MIVIDSWESGHQERQKLVDIRKNRNVLVVEALEYDHGSNEKPFSIYQSGEQGLLISEWFKYTPSHVTMIAINSTLNEMA